MKKTLFSFAALGALCATPLFAQEVPRANQPDPPVRPGQDAQDDSPRATQPRTTTQPGQNAEERQAAEARPAGQVRPAGQAQPGQRAAQGTDVQDTQEKDFAQHVAACLILSNEAEIALTEPAIEKLQSDAARELAQMIVKDHTAFVAKLKPHAPQAANLKLNAHDAHKNAASAKAAKNAAEANSTTDPAHGNATAADRSASESMADKALRIEKSYVEHKVQMIQERLNKEEGQNFEQAFLGCQIAGHISMLAKLEALEPEVQHEEVAQLIQQAKQKTQEHLQQAEQLMNQEKNVEEGQGQSRSGAQSQNPAQGQNRASDAAPATPDQDR